MRERETVTERESKKKQKKLKLGGLKEKMQKLLVQNLHFFPFALEN